MDKNSIEEGERTASNADKKQHLRQTKDCKTASQTDRKSIKQAEKTDTRHHRRETQDSSEDEYKTDTVPVERKKIQYKYHFSVFIFCIS